jgi:hypothetical protein
MTLTDDVHSSWQRFLDEVEPLRPDRYRYCRHLTRSPWDAGDLVQDAMSKAFVTLGTVFQPVPNRRAWLFRVASNLWIDRVRRARCATSIAWLRFCSTTPSSRSSVWSPSMARIAPKDPRTGSFAGSLGPITFDDRGGVPAQLLEGYLGSPARCEISAYRGGAILLFWYDHESGPRVRDVMTVETSGDRSSGSATISSRRT